MTKSCLKHTAIPGTSRLFSDYLYNFDRVCRFYDHEPLCPSSFIEATAAIQFPSSRRRQIVASLREQNPDAPALSLLEQDNGVAVVTGQQVGLFSGPAYTIYKAVTAARLAERLTAEGMPAAAIFWLATEDHDVAEVDHAWVFNASSTPTKLAARVAATAGPAGSAVLEDVPLDQLECVLRGFPHAAEVIDLVRQAYRPGVTLGDAFLHLLRELLKPLGLLFLDPLQTSFRKVVAPFLAEAVTKTPEIMAAVSDRSRDLEASGYHAQVFVDKETSPVFLLDRGRRVSFKWKDGRFVHKHHSFSPADLAERAADISPSALLRPVMQDYALPTVAYVGGPAEIAYFAQCEPVYHQLLGRMPVIVPRSGFTLLDDRSVKILDRYRMEASEVLCGEEELRSRIAARLVPSNIQQQLIETHATISSALAQAEESLGHFDPTLRASLTKSSAKIQYQLSKIAKKTEREIFHRDNQAIRAAERLSNTIYPHQHLQERMYTILPFLAQHGLDLVSRLYDAAHLACPDHMVRAVSDL